MAGRIPTSELEELFDPPGQVIHQVDLNPPTEAGGPGPAVTSHRLCAAVVHTITGHLSLDSNWFWSHKEVKNLIQMSDSFLSMGFEHELFF